MKDPFVDSFVIFKYTIVYCRIMYVHDIIKCVFLFFSRSFLTIIESMLGKIQITTPHQRIFLIYLKKIQYLCTC